ALRLRGGNAAAASALRCRPARALRGVPDALPRGSLPRAARDAEDVLAPRTRAAPDDLRPARAPRPVDVASPHLREAHVPARDRRARRRRSSRAWGVPAPDPRGETPRFRRPGLPRRGG